MSTDVDGADVLEAEVPVELRLHKRRHKASTGSIDMDLDIITLQHFDGGWTSQTVLENYDVSVMLQHLLLVTST